MTDLRTIERESIRAFVQSAADEGYLSGRVLDYGCGKQPYRDIVEAVGGEYHGFDLTTFPGSVVSENVLDGDFNHRDDATFFPTKYESVLCTQVVQYVPKSRESMLWLKGLLVRDGHLVLTYPTNWPEVEPEDLHRFTKAGMERLLTEAGFMIVRHERRAAVHGIEGVGTWRATLGEFALGYGCICRA